MADNVIYLGRGQILLGSYIVDAQDVSITKHSADYEYFESYEGIIPIRKQLDIHTELTFKVILTEQNVDSYKYDVNNLEDFEKYRGDFVELRRNFLDDIDGEVVVVASEMFKAFKGVVSSRKYDIEGGETYAKYDIEIKEVR